MYRLNVLPNYEVIISGTELDIAIPSPTNYNMPENKSKLRDMVRNAKEQKLKLAKDRMAMIKLSETLKNQEKSLNSEEEILKKEKLAVQQQRMELNELRAKLSHDQAKLNQLREKLGAENEQVSQALEELRIKAVELNKQRGVVKKASPLGDRKAQKKSTWSEIQNLSEEFVDELRQENKERSIKVRMEKRQNSLEIWL
ncbi:unnamed protein product [Blepharisma stoltei]|uniref:Uncharacterized protein n=1 Tax=Blepharisma stoltei TaxID=1481888 RepID=A0AAU9JBF0_9CILI|nr:unnamed protein product [Blepharisma stoltei]